MLILLYLNIIPNQHQFFLKIIKKHQKEKPRKMPQELMKEFIGKVCSITLFNAVSGITGKIISIEDNWLKVQEKDTVRLVNGDMIRDIKMLPEKYQK